MFLGKHLSHKITYFDNDIYLNTTNPLRQILSPNISRYIFIDLSQTLHIDEDILKFDLFVSYYPKFEKVASIQDIDIDLFLSGICSRRRIIL